MTTAIVFCALLVPVLSGQQRLNFEPLPPLPDEIGVAGPLVGLHNDVVIVAGGANFAKPDDPELWNVPKRYLSRAWVLEKTQAGGFRWRNDVQSFRLANPIAYSAVVSTPHGVLCLGGEDQHGPRSDAFLLRWDGKQIVQDDLPPDLPFASTACGAAIVGQYIYFVAGQSTDRQGVVGPTRSVWRIPMLAADPTNDLGGQWAWEQVIGWPSSAAMRGHAIVTAQHDGFANRLYVMGGRRFAAGSDKTDLNHLKFFSDVWSLDPAKFHSEKYDPVQESYDGENPWRRESDAPRALSAGSAVPIGPAHVLVANYADGSRIRQSLDANKPMSEFRHPGFPKTALLYNTITRAWNEIQGIPANQVTTPAVKWGQQVLLLSGEIRPRVRTRDAWSIEFQKQQAEFGVINMSILVIYLVAMLGIGVFFTLRNKTTDDYFRGGKNIPWFVAGCSIFATMLSSITYMAIPAKAFAQDWVYALGNVIILCVAPIAIYVALPFFRRIDATSAYEYLEKRFNRIVRWIGSGSFSLFHIFRMGVVLALAALALSSVTPLSPLQCVLVMGILSIIYCTLGGIEAVVWTDTIQTFILMFGAIACLYFAWTGAGDGSLQAALDQQKFHLVNLDFGSQSFTSMAIWVVVLGGFGQNIASYTADQAVVQRYMTTADQSAAARSIWLNGLLAIPAAIIFFGLGTAMWMFYRSNPALIDPTMTADRIMPYFISYQLPVGLAGLLVAGIFSAAQSTVSTSMNSGATTIVTDFLRPLGVCKSEGAYLWTARLVTLLMGIAGTCAGLLFVDPDIKSLFDEFIGILGMFLGVLAGLFALGATTRRANGVGSLIGAATAIVIMAVIFLAAKGQVLFGIDWQRWIDDKVGVSLYKLNGYLYAFVGITICYVIGYLASCLSGGCRKSISGLTLYARD